MSADQDETFTASQVLNQTQLARVAALHSAREILEVETRGAPFAGSRRALAENDTAWTLIALAEWILDGPKELEDPDEESADDEVIATAPLIHAEIATGFRACGARTGDASKYAARVNCEECAERMP